MKIRILHWKRAVFAVLLTLLLSATGVTNAVAQEFTVDNLNYFVNDDGVSVTLTGHANDYLWGALDIPENVSYDGITYTVTTIGPWAFSTEYWYYWDGGGVYSLSIPSSVTSIDNDAFYFGSLLWDGLLRITVDVGNPVYDSRDNCNAIIETSTNTLILGCKNTIIPNTVTSIGNHAFYSDASYIIPNSVTSIGYEAFFCNMASLTIGSSVTSIYNLWSFGQGDTLRILAETPPSLEWFDYGTLEFNVVYVPCGTLDAYVAAWGDEINFQEACSTYTITATGGSSVSGTGDYSYGETCTLTATSPYFWIHFAFWIDNGQVVSRDATYTFSVSGSRHLTAGFYNIFSDDITFADSNVESICISLWDLDGNGALSYDEAALVADLGSAFYHSDITLFSELPYFTGLSSIGRGAFYGSNLRYIVIPNSVTTIGSEAFSGCCNLCAVNFLSETPPEIGEGAFGSIIFYVPCGAGEAYSAVEELYWYVSIRELCSSCIYIFELYGSEGIGWNDCYLNIDYYEEGDWTWGGDFYFGGDGNSATYSTDIPSGCEVHLETCCDDETSFIVRDENGGIIDVDYHHSEYNDYYDFYTDCGSSYHNISATANPEEGGTVSGAGVYRTGQLCTLTATANEGYTFVNWTEYGTEVSTEAIFAFTATSSRNLVANFALPFTVTATASPTEGGVVSGGGEYDYGTECTLTATANEGYTFMYWTENGEVVSTEATYCFTVNCNRSLMANFALPFTITATANPPEGGTVTGSGMYDYGSTCTLTATAAEGYYFVGWKKDGAAISSNGTYTFTVTTSGDYIAVFEPGLYLGDGGTATRTDLPSLFFRRYTLSQQIYTADEIGMDGLITSIAFYNGGLTKTRNYNFYMINTDKTVFENSNDWITVTEEDLVYSGNVTMEAGTWTTIVLDTPFSYSVNSNLALITDDNTGSSTGHMAYRVFGADGNQAIRIFSDDTNYDPYNPSNYDGTLLSVKNQIVLGMQSVSDFYVISASANPAEGGMVTGTGTFPEGATCTLTATPNDGYIFTNWTKDGEVVSTAPIYSFTVTENATLVANFTESQDITQTTDFTEGWNWWSTYIEQDGIDGLSLLEEGLGTYGLVIKSQSDGYTEYYDDYDLWYGSINAINNESSYMVKTSASCQVSMTGTAAMPSQHPITVDANGWTWIGYPVTYNMDINAALDGLASIEGDMLKAQEGYAEFYEGYGWYGPLETLTSGMGYMYKSTSTSPATFTYPDNGRTAMRAAKHNHWVSIASAYPFNMTVTAVVELDGEELRSDRYELAAFANGESRGSVRLMYVEPIDRYVAFLTIAGEEATELSLSLYDMETGMEYFPAEENIVFEADATLGRLAEPFVVSFRGTTGVDELANSLRVYPNPVKAGERFSIGMNAESKAPMRVEIVNALGVVVSVKTSMQAPASIKAPEAAGIYTLKISCEKGTCYSKLIVR